MAASGDAVGFPQNLYFETGVIIIALILLGRWLEARAKRQTGAAIKALMGLQVRTARVIRDGVERDLSIEAVQVGDLVRVDLARRCLSTACRGWSLGTRRVDAHR